MIEPLRITRELLEHYLRATGWRKEPPAWGGPGRFVRRSTAISDLDIASYCDGTFESYTISAEGFRLGLCAAAEDDATRIAVLQEHKRSGAACYADDAVIIELDASRIRKLRAASIIPEQWEATR